MSRERYTQTEEKIALLDEQIEVFKQLIQACEEIKEGRTETTVCAKYDINRNYFRRLIFEQKLGFHCEPEEPPTDEDDTYWKNLWKDYCWQERLYCEIVGDYNYMHIPTFVEDCMDEALNRLTEREKEVILYRYRDCMTFDEIGEVYGLTKTRISQITYKALRKLRHPSRLFILKYGTEYDEKIKKARREQGNRMIECNKKIEDMKNSVTDAINKCEISNLRVLKRKIDSYLENLSDDIDDGEYSTELVFPFNVTDFSIRTYNCIIRAGYKSLLEFRGKPLEEVKHIRNLGTKGVNELVEKLAQYGIYLSNEDGEPYMP